MANGEDHGMSPVLQIRPPAGLPHPNLRECWLFRDLFMAFLWRDLAVRYRHAFLGITWVVLQPLATMAVLGLVLGRHGLTSDRMGARTHLMAFCGLCSSWTLITRSLGEGSRSLAANEALLTKVYFPRLFVPATPVCTTLVDLAIMSAVLLVLLPFWGAWPGLSMLLLPLFLLQALLLALGLAWLVSGMDLLFRDLRHLVPFLAQVWFFISPVIYPSSLVPGSMRRIYDLNPLVGIIEGVRWSVLGAPMPELRTEVLGASVSVMLFLLGMYVFRYLERSLTEAL